MLNNTELTLEEKVDRILKYQKRIHHLAIVKVVFGFLTFFVIVILPIIGVLYVGDYIANSVGLSMQEIGDTLKRVKDLTDLGGIDGIKSFLN